MPVMNIKIGRKSDTEPLFPSEPDEILIDCSKSPISVGILEGGMQSGETAVTFSLALPGGKTHVFFQTSAALVRALVNALNGAEERFRAGPD